MHWSVWLLFGIALLAVLGPDFSEAKGAKKKKAKKSKHSKKSTKPKASSSSHPTTTTESKSLRHLEAAPKTNHHTSETAEEQEHTSTAHPTAHPAAHPTEDPTEHPASHPTAHPALQPAALQAFAENTEALRLIYKTVLPSDGPSLDRDGIIFDFSDKDESCHCLCKDS